MTFHKPWTLNPLKWHFKFYLQFPASFFTLPLMSPSAFHICSVSFMEYCFPACDPHANKKIIRDRKAINFYSLEGLDINKIDTFSNLLSHSTDKICE